MFWVKENSPFFRKCSISIHLDERTTMHASWKKRRKSNNVVTFFSAGSQSLGVTSRKEEVGYFLWDSNTICLLYGCKINKLVDRTSLFAASFFSPVPNVDFQQQPENSNFCSLTFFHFSPFSSGLRLCSVQ